MPPRQPVSRLTIARRHGALRYDGASWRAALVVALVASAACCKRGSAKEGVASAAEERCPTGMVEVEGRVCVDAYEASVVEVNEGGGETPHPPHAPVTGLKVRAVSRGDVMPQAYISQTESRAACLEAGKRLCTDDEWKLACGGPTEQPYPYGATREDGACNDVAAVSPLNHYYDASRVGASAYTWEKMNDPRLNQLPGGLAKTGAFAKCRGPLAIYDMVGNLHEWTETPSTFRGGYYLDTQLHGPGCRYQTTAHMPTYHDYSTGFRCCKDVAAKQ